MKFDPLGGAAAFLLLAGTGAAAFAQPHPDGDGDKVKQIIVVREGAGGGHEAGSDGVRRFEMLGAADLANCNGGEKIVDEQSDGSNRKTKVIICRKGAPTAAEADRLEEALARITDNDHLSDEQKARIETALRSAIDRARSAR
jgi:hypothetical protein